MGSGPNEAHKSSRNNIASSLLTQTSYMICQVRPALQAARRVFLTDFTSSKFKRVCLKINAGVSGRLIINPLIQMSGTRGAALGIFSHLSAILSY